MVDFGKGLYYSGNDCFMRKLKGERRMVNVNRKKPFAALVSLILVSTLVATLLVYPAAKASTPPISIPTYAYIVVTPNPVGVGETVFVVMWLHMAPPTAAGIAGDRWRNFTVTVTRPDGTTETLGPFNSDPTGSTYTLYTPSQVGKYTFVFSYPGQVLSLYGPTGLPGASSPYINDTFLPSTATTTLTVQQEKIAKVPDVPLPTEFWTRPIEGQNVNWAGIASHWLRGAYLPGSFSASYRLWQTSGTAPGSPHIMWTMPIEFGGIVGGPSEIPSIGFYSGGSYEGRFVNAIIMWGRLYFPMPLGHSGTGGGYVCVDLKTGETIWRRDDLGMLLGNTSTGAPNVSIYPTFGQLYNYESQNQHGVVGGILWATTGTTWMAIDPFTGKWMFNLTGVPSGYEVYTKKGEIVRYVLSYNTTARTGWLALWNDTCKGQGLELVDPYNGTGTNAYQWRPNGKSVDMSKAYSWNVSITADLTGNAAPAIVDVIPGDIILGRSSAIAPGVGDKFTPDPYTVWAISDKPESRGQLLWVKTYPAPAGNITRRLGPVDPVNRVWTMFQVEDMKWVGYSLDNGQQLWGPVGYSTNDFNYYGSGEGGGARAVAAYGNLYVQGFGGELICMSTKDGSLQWKYARNSGIETPWGNYPIFIAAIADGKVYAFNNEHSPNYPLYKNERMHCLDAYTGKEIWTVMSWSGQSGGVGSSTAVLAEGMLVYYNYYDNQVYCVGKGPSAVTVEAPLTAVAKGQSITIRGTVTDQSPGAKSIVKVGRLSLVPAVSDESMGAWMEYLYMQKPKPSNATGVPVELTAVAPDGSVINIGTATSDANGIYAYVWAPPNEGVYKIVATFKGSESYWGATAETAVGVVAAPAASPSPSTSPTVSPSTSPTLSPSVPPAEAVPTLNVYAIAAVAAAIIAAVAVAAALIIRKRRK